MKDIGRREKNRSKSLTETVRSELGRSRRAALRRSLQNPHPEGAELAEHGFAEWTRRLPAEDIDKLVERTAGNPVRWAPGEGWVNLTGTEKAL